MEPQKTKLWHLFSHPLLLLIVGALLSSYLIPSITRQWQVHQKELEIKTDLVNQMNESVTRFLFAIQLNELSSSTQDEFNDAYLEWQIADGTIGLTVRAYFPESPMVSNWDTYSEAVEAFYALSGVADPNGRRNLLTQIHDYLNLTDDGTIDWESLAHTEYRIGDPTERSQYHYAWGNVALQLLEKNSSLVLSILDAPSALT